jgi:hypothetical protein
VAVSTSLIRWKKRPSEGEKDFLSVCPFLRREEGGPKPKEEKKRARTQKIEIIKLGKGMVYGDKIRSS